MGIFKLILFSLTLLFADENAEHILLLSHDGNLLESLNEYQDYVKREKAHNFEILQRIALQTLKQGSESKDLSVLKLTMIGAGISASAHSIQILEKGITSKDPEIELISLSQLSMLEEDRSSDLLLKAMSSYSLLSRIEASYQLAIKKHPLAFGQIESLMMRLPPQLKCLFPPLFATLGTNEAIDVLKTLLNDPLEDVRIEAIINAAHFRRDDLLPFIRAKILVSSPAEKEAAIFAVSELNDTSTIPLLFKSRSTENVIIASTIALNRLKSLKSCDELLKLASQNNLFAIHSLGNLLNVDDFLKRLLYSTKNDVRLNAASALLNKKNRASLPVLKEVLSENCILKPIVSSGHTQWAWKISYQGTEQEEALSLAIKEEMLKKIALLPESDFLEIARYLLTLGKNELVPTLVHLLQNLQTKEAIALLKEFSQKLGSPLIRDYCSLALYHLKEPSYENYVANWIKNNNSVDIIQLRTLIPRNTIPSIKFELSTEEKSHLLIDMYSYLAERRDEKSIFELVEALKKANSKNRYALIGLLLRATQ